MFHNKKSAKALLAEANSEVEQISAQEAIELIDDENTVFVDVREMSEAQQGMVPGAVHAPRGMLEFYVDPESPAHKDLFAQDKRFVFFCGSGGRSALATVAVQRMGLEPVAHIAGGFPAWKEAGGPVDEKD
jgi:rhodanese-related sulfurtransferase